MEEILKIFLIKKFFFLHYVHTLFTTIGYNNIQKDDESFL